MKAISNVVDFLAPGAWVTFQFRYGGSIDFSLETFTPPEFAGASLSTLNIGYGLPLNTSVLLTSAIAYELANSKGQLGVLQLLGVNGERVFK